MEKRALYRCRRSTFLSACCCVETLDDDAMRCESVLSLSLQAGRQAGRLAGWLELLQLTLGARD